MEKKKIYAFIVPLCTIVVLAAFCWWGYNRLSLKEEQKEVNLYALVPSDCEALLETNDISALHKTIHRSHYIGPYEMLNVSDLLKLVTDNIETIAQQQAHGLSTEMNRQLLMSFHQPGSSHDQVIYGRFGNGDIGSITRLMQQGIGTRHAPKKLTYKGEDIIIYPLGRDFLACYFKPGFFAVSLQKKLIEKVIDAHTGEKSLAQSATFNNVNKPTKHDEQLSLYLPPKKGESAWKHFEIRMNADAIYLTGNHTLADSCETSDDDTLIGRTDGTFLPKQVQMMVQMPFKPLAKETGRPTLSALLDENDCHEVTTILFSPTPPDDTVHHQLLMFPLTTENAERMKQSLRHPMEIKRRPSIRTAKGGFPTWQCNNDTTLHGLFIPCPHTTECWLTIYQHHLLVSTRRETLQNYIMEMENEAPHSAPTNQEAYVQCLSDLAEQANYTLVADMNDIVAHHPAIAKETSLIPDFFFKHKDFFKHFMLSTQHICNGEQMNTQVILTYQGDSIR